CPMLALGLMPETTRSIFSSMRPMTARATQSEGAPSLARAGVPSSSVTSYTRRGRCNVLTWPPAVQFWSGARTLILPNGFMACARVSNPGAVTPSSFVTKMCMLKYPVSSPRPGLLLRISDFRLFRHLHDLAGGGEDDPLTNVADAIGSALQVVRCP